MLCALPYHDKDIGNESMQNKITKFLFYVFAIIFHWVKRFEIFRAHYSLVKRKLIAR